MIDIVSKQIQIKHHQNSNRYLQVGLEYLLLKSTSPITPQYQFTWIIENAGVMAGHGGLEVEGLQVVFVEYSTGHIV